MLTMVCLMTLVVVSPAAVAASGDRTVAILALQPLGTEQAIVAPLEDILRSEVGQLRGIALQPRAVTSQKAPGSGDSCQGEMSCLANIGQALGVDLLLYGTVATLGNSYVLDLKLVDVTSKAERGRQSVTLSGDKAVMIDGVRAVSTQLLAPEQYVGSLELKLATPGAEVFIDGKPVGQTPLRTIGNLPPGTHGLKIVLKGFNDFDRFIEVKFARTTVVNVSLSGNSLDAVIEGRPEAASQPVEVAAAPTPVPAAPPGAPLLLLAGSGVAVLGAAALAGGMAVLGTMYLSMLTYTRGEGGKTVVTDAAAYGALENAYTDFWWIGYALGGAGLASVALGGGLIAWDLLASPASD